MQKSKYTGTNKMRFYFFFLSFRRSTTSFWPLFVYFKQNVRNRPPDRFIVLNLKFMHWWIFNNRVVHRYPSYGRNCIGRLRLLVIKRGKKKTLFIRRDSRLTRDWRINGRLFSLYLIIKISAYPALNIIIRTKRLIKKQR